MHRGGLVVELGLEATDAVAELVFIAVAVQCGQLLAQPLLQPFYGIKFGL